MDDNTQPVMPQDDATQSTPADTSLPTPEPVNPPEGEEPVSETDSSSEEPVDQPAV